jgi:hypothetical protein
MQRAFRDSRSWRSFVTLRFFILTAILTSIAVAAFAQADTFIGQFTNSNAESFAGGISGDGRFVVFESRGNLATENPRNEDGNVEIFLWDYAQRRIFQLTNTKSVLTDASKAVTFDNIKVDIANKRPVISNDGRWIAFGSNATDSITPGDGTTPPIPGNGLNPGSFNGNSLNNVGCQITTPTPTPSPSPTASPSPSPTPFCNNLTLDANMEMWLYEIPAYTQVDLKNGDELPLTDLSTGTFTRITNTPPSRFPQPGSTMVGPFVADDNHDVTIDDTGNLIAFVSTRNLVPAVGNATPDDNEEIFTYLRSSGTLQQVTKTPRGVISNPIYSKNPVLNGAGTRVAFASTGDGPIVGMTAGDNPSSSRNEEVFYADLVSGQPSGNSARVQVTKTTPTNPGETVNIFNYGRRMSRDGRFIAFDSFAELGTSNPNKTAFALYVFDTVAGTFQQYGPRSDADSGAGGGDVFHYPTFTDISPGGTATTLMFETRLNIKTDGTVATTAADGQNNIVARPPQIYIVPLGGATFTRLTKFPAPSAGTFLASTQPIASDTSQRTTFNLALTELGTGNQDLQSESFYMLKPAATGTTTATLNYFTGASALKVSPSPVPTASPTPTPTASPSPTPVTPPAVLGTSPGSLAFVTFDPAQAITERTAVGSIQRSFSLPIELSGVSMSINGVAVGLKHVDSTGITFVVPPFLSSTTDGTKYPVVINNNGTVITNEITIVPARPDIFTNLAAPGPGGRAQATNVTNRVPTTEPFVVHTVRIRGGMLTSTVLRLRLTGIANTTAAVISIRIGNVTISGARVLTGGVLVEPGVYTVDFTLPPELNGAGDQPIIVTVTANGVSFSSRLDDTAPRISFL